MLYITVALSAEARGLIDAFKLTRTYTLPYTMFENEQVKLVVTGVGEENAMLATSAFLGHFVPKKNDVFINVGICAAPKEFAIGEALLAHKLICSVSQRLKTLSYFPDILFEHPLAECELLCVDTPASSPLKMPADMESYGVYKAASRFLDTHQILIFKVVSDHFEPLHISKELATQLIVKNLQNLQNIIHSAEFVINKKPLFTSEEERLIHTVSELLTKSQSDAFYDACCYYKLHHQKALHAKCPLGIELPSSEKLSKKERSEYLEQLIKTLTL